MRLFTRPEEAIALLQGSEQEIGAIVETKVRAFHEEHGKLPTQKWMSAMASDVLLEYVFEKRCPDPTPEETAAHVHTRVLLSVFFGSFLEHMCAVQVFEIDDDRDEVNAGVLFAGTVEGLEK